MLHHLPGVYQRKRCWPRSDSIPVRSRMEEKVDLLFWGLHALQLLLVATMSFLCGRWSSVMENRAYDRSLPRQDSEKEHVESAERTMGYDNPSVVVLQIPRGQEVFPAPTGTKVHFRNDCKGLRKASGMTQRTICHFGTCEVQKKSQ